MRHGFASVGSAILAALVWGACSTPPEGTRIVLITIDTLRNDSVAGAAEGSATMPRLQSWATKATRFTRCFSATASTQPTHASLFTGLHPWQHGVSRNGQRLADEHETVAERLRSVGFSTSAVVASLPVSHHFGFAQGFDEFEDSFDLGRIDGQWLGDAERAAVQAPPKSGQSFYKLGVRVTETALAQLDRARSRRQFFWFHYFDPHDPYGDTGSGATRIPGGLLREIAQGRNAEEVLAHARGLYDADVSFLDASLARVIGRLERTAQEIETHVVVVADHGESFGEGASVGHGRRLIPSQIQVPCILRSPRIPSGTRPDVTGSVDISATLLALAGLEERAPESPARPGRSLLRPPRGPTRAFGMRRTYEKPYRDLRTDGSMHLLGDRLFYAVDPDGVIHRGNKTGLADEPAGGPAKERSKHLQTILAGFEAELDRTERAAPADPELDPEVERGLRALGYVD